MVVHPVEYYNANAREYARKTMALDVTHLYNKFLPRLPKGAHILDAGCGSGRDSLYFLQQGYRVSAFDASPALVKEANDVLPIDVQVMELENMNYQPETFDAIWACASLLHLTPDTIQEILTTLKSLLKPKGLFFCSFKKGTGTWIDNLGRRFLNMSEKELSQLLNKCQYTNIDTFSNTGPNNEGWINATATPL